MVNIKGTNFLFEYKEQFQSMKGSFGVICNFTLETVKYTFKKKKKSMSWNMKQSTTLSFAL